MKIFSLTRFLLGFTPPMPLFCSRAFFHRYVHDGLEGEEKDRVRVRKLLRHLVETFARSDQSQLRVQIPVPPPLAKCLSYTETPLSLMEDTVRTEEIDVRILRGAKRSGPAILLTVGGEPYMDHYFTLRFGRIQRT